MDNTIVSHWAAIVKSANWLWKLANPLHLFEMTTLPSTIIRHALIDYRSLLLRLAVDYPDTFKHTHPQLIAQIDDGLLSIEGNISQVAIIPVACKS